MVLKIGNLVIIRVYLTYANGTDKNTLSLIDELSKIQSIINESLGNNKQVIIIGDFNVDLSKANDHSRILKNFLKENEMVAKDTLVQQEVNYTFRSHSGLTWIDHVICHETN